MTGRGRGLWLSAVMAFPALAIVLALAACGQEHSINTRYQCEGGKELNARFVDGKYVEITLDNITHNIPRIDEPSGARYEIISEGKLFWSKGIDAVFVPHKGAIPLKCRRGQGAV